MDILLCELSTYRLASFGSRDAAIKVHHSTSIMLHDFCQAKEQERNGVNPLLCDVSKTTTLPNAREIVVTYISSPDVFRVLVLISAQSVTQEIS